MSKVIGPFLFIIASIGLYFSYISGAITASQEFKTLNHRIEKAMEDTDALLKKQEMLAQQYEAYNEVDILRLEKMLPDNINSVRIILDIDNLANDSSLDIKAFEVPNTLEGVSETPPIIEGEKYAVHSARFTLEMEGRYESLKKFLYNMETSLSLLDVVGLEIDTQKENNIARTGQTVQYDPSRLVYKVTLQTYWFE